MAASKSPSSVARLALSCALVALVRCSDDGDAMEVLPLPNTTVPVLYELQFHPRLDGGDGGAAEPWFSGRAKITVVATATADQITLNVEDLRVANVTVIYKSAGQPKNLAVAELVKRPNVQQLHIRLGEPVVPKQMYEVTVHYEASIRTDQTGLYLTSYEENNVTKRMAVTFFQPNYARRAFPCYDEPIHKTEFIISVIKEKNLTALSNMPIESIDQGPNDETELVIFKKTPPMSSYLVALYVGDFVPNKNDSFITIFTSKDYINQTGYAETEAPKHLRVMEEYTGINYTLPKIDLLALPDMSITAMENWGMNTYREFIILLHEETTSFVKMQASMLMQHELTHQWFGNLVTCSEWNYMWLNEGFATYFEYMATGMVNTNWQMEEMFVIDIHQDALLADQFPEHPITMAFNNTIYIDALFDSITYNKAASVLRMLKYLITENLFQSSLQVYLNIKNKKSSNPSEFYEIVDFVLFDHKYELGNELTVEKFMSNWTLQIGYPVIYVTKNETTNSFTVNQSPFFIYTEDAPKYINSAWDIGLTYTTESSKNFSATKPSYWTDEYLKSTVIPAPQNSGWYVFNIQSTGFYRVNYDLDNWMKLIEQLKHDPTAIHTINRAQLIDDAFNLARAGRLNYSIPLYLTEYLEKENSVIPWYSVEKCFSSLLIDMRRSEQGYEDFKTYVRKLAGTIYKKLEDLVSKGSSDINILKAWDLFGTWACSLDDIDCTNNALKYFKKWQAGDRISADIKDAAFCAGIKYSNGSDVFDQMFDLYKASKSISEKWSVASAMACSSNRTQLKEYMNHLLDGPQGPIRSKEYEYIVPEILYNPLGFDVLYEFLSSNLNRILNELTNGKDIAKMIYSSLIDKTVTDAEIEKVRRLKDNSSVPYSLKSPFNRMFKNVHHRLLWFSNFADEINNWILKKNVQPSKQ